MKALIEFLPLLAFGIAYWLRDVYAATAVLMIAMPLMLLALWLLTRRVETMPLISTLLVLGFGALTLFLHSPRFIQWKATLFLWGVALVLAINAVVSRELLVRKFLAALAEGRRVTERQWRALNLWWILVYAAIGGANLLFAYYTPEAVWARFKVFGVTGALLAFLVAQAVWLQRLPEERPAASP
jgi:intracellular septation protein